MEKENTSLVHSMEGNTMSVIDTVVQSERQRKLSPVMGEREDTFVRIIVLQLDTLKTPLLHMTAESSMVFKETDEHDANDRNSSAEMEE